MVKISIITRAYNVENYIEQCILSVINQTLSDFEYFVVDNGSTDNTGKLIEKIASSDKRIKYVKLERNYNFSSMELLVREGSGEFFAMLDSDDWLEPNFFEELYNNTKAHNLDIGLGGSKFHIVQNGKVAYRKSEFCGIIPKNEFSNAFRYIHQFFRPIWGKIFASSIVKEAWDHIQKKRPSFLSYGGDTYTCFELLNYANGIFLSDKVLHNYRIHPESGSYKYSSERFKSDIYLFFHEESFLKQFGPISEVNRKFLFLVYFSAIKDTIRVLYTTNISISEKAIELNEIFNHELTNKLLSNYRSVDTQNFIINIFNLALKIDEEFAEEKNKLLLTIIGIEPILSQTISNPSFIKKYKELVILVFNHNYNKSLELIIHDLSEEVNGEELFIDSLLNLAIKLAALENKPDTFIWLHELLFNYLFERNRLDEALLILHDLEEMLPDNSEIRKFKEYINKYIN